jgi:hypothetical protein
MTRRFDYALDATGLSINGVPVGSGSGAAYIEGHGNPNGVTTADKGTSYYDLDVGILYMNVNDGTVWVLL